MCSPRDKRSPKAISGRKQYSTIIRDNTMEKEQTIQEVAVHPETGNSTVSVHFQYNQHSRHIIIIVKGRRGKGEEGRERYITKKESPFRSLEKDSLIKRQLPTLPLLRSTIGVTGLNFSVRNGKRWNPGAIAT